VDWYVLLLSPIVVLAVVMLLGFTGCHLLFGLLEVDEPSYLVFKVRVPAYLTVLDQPFSWKLPSATMMKGPPSLQSLDRTDEAGTFVLSYRLEDPEPGTWSVKCHLIVQDTSSQGDVMAMTTFVLMPAEGSTYTMLFETTGRPDTPPFDVHVSTVPM
jgi:hypothetical protein